MTGMEILRLVLGGALLTLGVFVMVTAVIGNYKFQYVLQRMHAAGLGDTMGIALILLGIVVLRGTWLLALKCLVVLVLLELTSPVASHMILKMEIENGSPAGPDAKSAKKASGKAGKRRGAKGK